MNLVFSCFNDFFAVLIDEVNALNKFLSGKLVTFIFAVVLLVLGLMYYNHQTGKTNFLQNAVGVIITPLQKGVTSAAVFVSERLAYFTEYDELKAENERLREEILALKSNLNNYHELKLENDSLRDFIGLVEVHPEFEYVYGEVIARDPDSMYYTFTINKGTTSGIDRYDAVITPDGLVGIISEVGATFSKVTSIIGDITSIGARIVRTHDIALLESDIELRKSVLCRLSYLPSDNSASNGDLVETSGLGGVFPEGIVIGSVKNVLSESHNLSSYAVVVPAVDFTDIKDVMIIKSFE